MPVKASMRMGKAGTREEELPVVDATTLGGAGTQGVGKEWDLRFGDAVPHHATEAKLKDTDHVLPRPTQDS